VKSQDESENPPLSLDDLLQDSVAHYSLESIGLGDVQIIYHFTQGCKHAVELGTHCGTTTRLLAQLVDQVTTVDVFEQLDLIQNDSERQHYQWHYELHPHPYGQIASELAAYPNVRVIQGRTYEAAKLVSDPIDFLLVDADHSREGVTRDFEAWFPNLAPGAWILFHDATTKPGVIQFLNEYARHDDRLAEMRLVVSAPHAMAVFRKQRTMP
jgi:hypothetical protein